MIFIPLQASAADYPTKPITILCAFSAGGGTDIMSRLLAKHLQEEFGQPVLVVNKTGGFGSVAAMEVLHAPAHGYTIGIAAFMVLMGQRSVWTILLTSTLLPVGSYFIIRQLLKIPLT